MHDASLSAVITRLAIPFVVTAALLSGCGGSSDSGSASSTEAAAPDPKAVTCADYDKLDEEAQTNLVTDILEITDADKDKKQDPAVVLPMAGALCAQVPDATVYEVLSAPPVTTVPVTTAPAAPPTP